MSIPLRRGFSLGPGTYQLSGFHGVHMRVAQDLLFSVAFICVGDQTAPTPCATGFFIIHKGARYFVTAKHVAEELSETPFYLRFNQNGPGIGLLPIDLGMNDEPLLKWIPHPDQAVDLAVMAFPIDVWGQGMVAIDLNSEAAIKLDNPISDAGCGDMCHVIGLFSRVPGSQRNIAVVHTGHIAAMPDSKELLPVELNGNLHGLEGFLVEISNLRGLSGAPVFVRGGIELNVPIENRPKMTITSYRPDLKLLGVWAASWDIRASSSSERVPVGIGIVTPAYRLIELLDSPAVVENTKAWIAKLNAATAD